MPGKMHADEVDTDPSLVRRLLADQFPRWADLPIDPVESSGTDNAIYRLGEHMAELQKALVKVTPVRASSASFGISSSSQPGESGQWRG